MIGIYLSGTGNTKHCVEKLVCLIDDTAKCVPLEYPPIVHILEKTIINYLSIQETLHLFRDDLFIFHNIKYFHVVGITLSTQFSLANNGFKLLICEYISSSGRICSVPARQRPV